MSKGDRILSTRKGGKRMKGATTFSSGHGLSRKMRRGGMRVYIFGREGGAMIAGRRRTDFLLNGTASHTVAWLTGRKIAETIGGRDSPGSLPRLFVTGSARALSLGEKSV